MWRNWACILTTGIWSAISFVFVTVIALVDWSGDATLWWVREMWSRVLVWVSGAQLIIEGAENVDPQRPTIYLSNHQSTLDIPALFIAVPIPFRFVAKHQLSYVPVIGWYLAMTRHIFVNRGKTAAAIQSLEAAGRRIRSGTSIVIFPEGTRSEDGRVLPFKKGPFALALQARVPVVPITVEGSGRVMPKNRWKITPGPVRIRIGRPIDTTGFQPKDRLGLARAVRDAMIQQSRALGGQGGDPEPVFAAAGQEGRAVPVPAAPLS